MLRRVLSLVSGAPPAPAGSPPAAVTAGPKAPPESPEILALLNDAPLRAVRRAPRRRTVTGEPRGVTALKVAGQPYLEVRGGQVKLGHGSIVEGSIEHGGIQPHYVIDLDHPQLKDLLAHARSIGEEPVGVSQKIAAIEELVRSRLADQRYDAPLYLALTEKRRRQNRNVSLGDYLERSAGVCREHGMLAHLALTAAGFDSRYLYVSAWQGDFVEDHGFAVVDLAGETWAVDAYNRNFDGFLLSDLMLGTHEDMVRAPWAEEVASYECRIELRGYPAYYVPVVPLPDR